MSILIWFLTVVLVLDCLFLLLLILVQLPKKDAGIGQAFGGATTDALFGAGSGNALTKMTKYATGIFLVLTLGLSILNAHQKNARSTLEENMSKLSKASLPAGNAPTTGSNAVTPLIEATNALLNTNIVVNTNVAAKPAVPAPAAAATNGTTPVAK
jgi:protein translocase SecG subunit